MVMKILLKLNNFRACKNGKTKYIPHLRSTLFIFLIYAYNTIERCLFKKGSQKKR